MLAEMVARGRLVLLAPDGTAEWLVPKAGAFDGVRELDGAYLEHALDGLDEMLALVGSGTSSGPAGVAAGILIRPTSLAEIQRTAREGLLMPPKSTFFTPKLRTGLVIRPTAPLG
jgi:hypothetical protein